MGKSSKNKQKEPQAPAFTPSSIMYGDQVIGSTYMDGNGQIVSQYNVDPAEAARKQQIQQQINSILPSLGQTAPEVGKRYDQMRDDYIGQQTDLFNKEYDKSLKGLREDIGSRFGTLTVSPYFDQLNDLEKNVKAPAYLDIQRQGSLYRKDLDDQEQGRKLKELSALGYTFNNDQANFLQNLQAPLNQSNLINNFNQNQYSQRLQQYNNQLAQKQNKTNSFLSFFR